MYLRRILLAACVPLLLAGCSTIPGSGPYGKKINASNQVEVKIATHNAENSTLKYMLANVEPNLLAYIAKNPEGTSKKYNWPDKVAAEDIMVNVGDTIQVAIFESQSGGLFIPADSSTRPGNFISLPPQTINSTGLINVPYAGEVQAAGKTTEEISQKIVERLSNKAIEPQVVVSFTDRAGAEVSVIGDVNNAQRLSLGFNQYKVLDAIAAAGGPVSPGYETRVSLQRDEKEYDILFDELVVDPKKNIYSEVNDTLYLYREPQTFTAYGAVATQDTIPFGKRKLLLSEALGLARGLADNQANPAEVYIYRQRKYPYYTKGSPTKTAQTSIVKKVKSKAPSSALSYERAGKPEPSFSILSKVGTEDNKPQAVFKDNEEDQVVKTAESGEEGEISIIFRLNMRQPDSFFLAQQFVMEDQDILYVANAKTVELSKFLNVLNPAAITNVNAQDGF